MSAVHLLSAITNGQNRLLATPKRCRCFCKLSEPVISLNFATPWWHSRSLGSLFYIFSFPSTFHFLPLSVAFLLNDAFCFTVVLHLPLTVSHWDRFFGCTIPAPALDNFPNTPVWPGIHLRTSLHPSPTIASMILLHLRASRFLAKLKLQTEVIATWETMKNTVLGTGWHATCCRAKWVAFITPSKFVVTFPMVAEI